MLSLTVHESPGALSELEDEWAQLCCRVQDSTPFQHPAWLIPWWRYFGSGQLQLLTMRRGARLAAVLPLFLHTWEGVRRLSIAGTGISDYLDMVAEPEAAAAAACMAAEWADSRSSEYDIACWPDLPPSSPLLGLSGRQVAGSTPCVALPLPVSPRIRLRSEFRQLAALGELRFATELRDDSGEILHRLFQLHTRAWLGRGQPGVLAEPGVQQFHLDVAARMAASGALRLYSLHVGGRTAAVCYAFRWKATLWYYLGSFEAEFARYSPGSLLIEYAMEQAAAEGAATWDFLRGEEAYKYRWGGNRIPKYELCLRANQVY